MPPHRNSRHIGTIAFKRNGGVLYLSTPDRIAYEEREDTIIHEAMDGETVYGLAEKYFGEDGWKRWDIIAQFQPNPIIDPTVPFEVGQTVYIPSRRFIEERVTNKSRKVI